MNNNNNNKNNYNSEVIDRWGNSKEYLEFKNKSKNYTNEKYDSIAKEMNSIFDEFYLCLCSNEKIESDNVMILVKKLQDYISSHFYNCSNKILLSLGKLYICDERFKNNIDYNRTGTALYINKAIEYYCNK